MTRPVNGRTLRTASTERSQTDGNFHFVRHVAIIGVIDAAISPTHRRKIISKKHTQNLEFLSKIHNPIGTFGAVSNVVTS